MAETTRPKNRRAEILGAATRLFSQHGFRGASIRTIASAAGITEAAIYRHFESKVSLYEAVIQEKSRQHDIAAYLAEKRGEGDIEAVLTRMAEHMLGFLEEDPELLGLMFNNSVESGPGAAVLFHEIRLPYIDYLASELTERVASGEVREIDPFITSRCFVGMVMDCALSVGVWNKLTEFEFHANDVICNNVPIFARGLVEKRVPG